MIWCAFTFAFCGFLRAGELCAIWKNTFVPSSTLLSKLVEQKGSTATLRLLTSKIDQMRCGTTVTLHQTTLSVSRSHVSELRWRPKASQPPYSAFFQIPERRVPYECVFLSDYPETTPEPSRRTPLRTHSFRIGAATAAAANNVQDSAIQAAGRWRSLTYRGYIRLIPSVPRETFY